MVWYNTQPQDDFYWSAVTREVTINEVPKADFSWGGHGVIGASAAATWPGVNHTFEAISWRENKCIVNSTRRDIDIAALELVDSDPETFMSRDMRSKNILIAPRGNCPVLFGLRAKTHSAAEKNCEILISAAKTEQVEGYIIFKTNQATDDHLTENKTGFVTKINILKRGTVVIETQNQGKLLAFGESGEVKLLSQWLQEGDLIEFNGLKAIDQSVHLEKLRVLKAKPNRQRPLCDDCQVTMKSMGKNQAVRCPKCRRTSQILWLEIERKPPFDNWVQPPNDARRHLAKPLDWN
jgi:tRNA(Ile2)-agmatinylcytidine synthase